MDTPEPELIQSQFDEAAARSIEPSRYPAMSYEQGVRDALAYVLGESDDPPMGVVD